MRRRIGIRVQTLLQAISGRHIVAALMVFTGWAMVARSVGSVAYLRDALGIHIPTYALSFVVFGVMLAGYSGTWFTRWLWTTPLATYLGIVVYYTITTPGLIPYVPLVLYGGLYVLGLYFLLTE